MHIGGMLDRVKEFRVNAAVFASEKMLTLSERVEISFSALVSALRT
jgi:hypothetical protein